MISVMCENICRSERLAYEGQPINIGIIIVKSTAHYSKRLIENSTQEIVFDCLFLILWKVFNFVRPPVLFSFLIQAKWYYEHVWSRRIEHCI